MILRAASSALRHRQPHRQRSDPGFNLDVLAASAGVSRRYVQHLLEDTGKSFTPHLLEHRLQRALALLTAPRSRRLSVADVPAGRAIAAASDRARQIRRAGPARP